MLAKRKYLIVVGGPTASGKTSVAIQLAQHYQTEILSCDSRQFYKEMSIGTAKPTPEELAQATHHFIDSLHITEKFTVGDYEKEALAVLEKIYQKKDIAIVTGGSGLFIRALCEGLDEFPDVPSSVRQDLEQVLQSKGISALQEELKIADPVYYQKVDIHNSVRLIRALSVCRVSGQPFSSFQNQVKPPRPFTPIYLLLDMDRKILYDRINRRVDLMLAAGLLAEAKQLYPQKHLNALQTVGYQELFEFFDGQLSETEAVELIKRNSRRYAKRQMTWFRKRPYWQRFAPSAVPQMRNHIDELISTEE